MNSASGKTHLTSPLFQPEVTIAQLFLSFSCPPCLDTSAGLGLTPVSQHHLYSPWELPLLWPGLGAAGDLLPWCAQGSWQLPEPARAADASSVHQQLPQQEEQGLDQVQECARTSAELGRAHGGECMELYGLCWPREDRQYLIWHKVSSVRREDIEHGIKLKWGR